MIVAITSAAQTLEAGQALTFDIFRKTGCSEYLNAGSTNTYLKPNGLYLVDFSGNVGPTAAAAVPVELTIQFNGAPLQDGAMDATTTAVIGNYTNVSRSVAISTHANCCFNIGTAVVTVVNTGTNAVVVAPGSSLRINRVG